MGRELEEFCDGLLGCAALMVHPIPILILVAAHGAACYNKPILIMSNFNKNLIKLLLLSYVSVTFGAFLKLNTGSTVGVNYLLGFAIAFKLLSLFGLLIYNWSNIKKILK